MLLLSTGSVVGCWVGFVELVGTSVGLNVGCVGSKVGFSVGIDGSSVTSTSVGIIVGVNDGTAATGCSVGTNVGPNVGCVGCKVGLSVGIDGSSGFEGGSQQNKSFHRIRMDNWMQFKIIIPDL